MAFVWFGFPQAASTGGNKMKWLHALSMCAADTVSEAELTAKPKGCTKSPYSALDDATAKPTKRSRSTYEDNGAVAGALYCCILLRGIHCALHSCPRVGRCRCQPHRARTISRSFTIWIPVFLSQRSRAYAVCPLIGWRIVVLNQWTIRGTHLQRFHVDVAGIKVASGSNPTGWLRPLGRFLACVCCASFAHRVAHAGLALYSSARAYTENCCTSSPYITLQLLCWLQICAHVRSSDAMVLVLPFEPKGLRCGILSDQTQRTQRTQRTQSPFSLRLRCIWSYQWVAPLISACPKAVSRSIQFIEYNDTLSASQQCFDGQSLFHTRVRQTLSGLVPGHVLVVPVAHDIPCVAAAKDDTASEVQRSPLARHGCRKHGHGDHDADSLLQALHAKVLSCTKSGKGGSCTCTPCAYDCWTRTPED